MIKVDTIETLSFYEPLEFIEDMTLTVDEINNIYMTLNDEELEDE